jgi:hypothetical protein
MKKKKQLDAARSKYQAEHKKRKKDLEGNREALMKQYTSDAKQACKKRKAELDHYADSSIKKRQAHVSKVLQLLQNVL